MPGHPLPRVMTPVTLHIDGFMRDKTKVEGNIANSVQRSRRGGVPGLGYLATSLQAEINFVPEIRLNTIRAKCSRGGSHDDQLGSNSSPELPMFFERLRRANYRTTAFFHTTAGPRPL